jgi:hypothetical protein
MDAQNSSSGFRVTWSNNSLKFKNFPGLFVWVERPHVFMLMLSSILYDSADRFTKAFQLEDSVFTD